jgi:S1-C subfamily serine protease
VLTALLRDGRVRRSYLGVAGQDAPLPRLLVREHGLPSARGIAVNAVSKSSPADEAGLRAGDIILDYGGTPVSGVDDLHRVLTEDQIGVAVPMRILRQGAPRRVIVVPREVE